MSTDPIICKMCAAGQCKLGDTAKACGSPQAPAGVVTVQDMVNYTAIQKAKK